VVLGCGLQQRQLGQQLLLELLLPAAAFADDTAEDQIPTHKNSQLYTGCEMKSYDLILLYYCKENCSGIHTMGTYSTFLGATTAGASIQRYTSI
jgi:hypothetical protein